jgi:hypothetical protein
MASTRLAIKILAFSVESMHPWMLEVPALRAQPGNVKATPVPWGAVGEPVLRFVEEAGVIVECEGRLAHIAREPTPLLSNENVAPPISRCRAM